MTNLTRSHIVIIGAGMAGSKLASALINDDCNCDVTLIGEESKVGYNRIMLSSLLANEITESDMTLVDLPAMTSLGAKIISDDAVVGVDSKNRFITLQSKREIQYDKLVFATGSRASILPIKGCDADNVMGFRTWHDVDVMTSLPKQSNISVIGGGLLGLEAAVGLVKRGHKVTLIHRSNHILNRQLDVTAASLLQKTLEEMGVEFRLGFAPKELIVDDAVRDKCVSQHLVKRAHSVVLTSDEVIPTDLVVMATGITPEISLAKQAQLDVNKAINVNAFMQTSIRNIYALGECCEFQSHTFGLVAPIWQQLNVLLDQLNNTPKESTRVFQIEAIPTKLKVSGVNLFSVGDITGDQKNSCITLLDASQNTYRKLIIKKDRVVGAILYGDVIDGGWYFQLIQDKTPIDGLIDYLAFGEVYCQTNIANIKVA